MYRSILYAAAALILIIGSVTAQTAEERKSPVRAKEPTVVTVEGKRGEVAVDQSTQDGQLKKPNFAKRLATKVGRGLGHAWHGVVHVTEEALGLDDVTEKRKDSEAAR